MVSLKIIQRMAPVCGMALLVPALLLAGCKKSAPLERALVPAQSMDVSVISPAADNFLGAATTAIATTVFIPSHREGETYPLILHSHGWGGDRITAADAAANLADDVPSDFYSVILDRQVRHLWEAGYAVISFDQRGFGGSSGASRVMDPAYETRDAIAILDWAEQNLELSRDAGGDPLVGSIGGSYGGGFQFMLATQDPRLDAIVAGATWYDLPQALVPNGVIKKLFDVGLCAAAKQAQRKLDPLVEQICAEAAENAATKLEEDVTPSLVQFLHEHGLAYFENRHNDPSDSFAMRKVDALLVQGNRDVLFPVSQALANLRFLSSLGGDVRLLSNEHGHILPASLSSQPRMGWWGCGPTDSIAAINAWFDGKLRGRTERLTEVPALCLSLDDTHSVRPATVPVAGNSYVVSIPETTVTGQQNDYGGQAATFIPLSAAISGNDKVLAGIPVADLTVTSSVPGTEGVAFLGVGIRKVDGSIKLVDDQVNPLRSSRAHAGEELIVVGELLADGDTPGVLLYGSFHQYEPAAPGNFQTNAYTVAGTVRLPVLSLPVQVRTP